MGFGVRRATTLCALAIAACAAWAAGGAAVARAFTARVGVTNAPVTRPLPDGFLGLALEYNTIPQWVGTGSGPVDPVLVRLIDNLDPVGGPMVRVGGQSTDRTWWPVPGMSRPLGVTYNLTSRWTAAARGLAQAIHARLLLGINLEAGRTRISQQEATELVNGVGRENVGALAIGNEPDLYTRVPWYRQLGARPLPWYSHSGTPVYARPPGYGPSQFLQELSRTLKVMPRLPITDPETDAPAWQDALHRLLSPDSRLRMLTTHAYGLNQCITDPSSPQYPTVPNLLSLPASRDLLGGTAAWVRLAHRDGAAFRVDEMGSVTCNGRVGVSDTMASALWAVDALFDVARAGVDGVNLHTYPGSDNGLFDLHPTRGGWQGAVHPLYYGSLMFAQAAPVGSRLLRIDAGGQGQLRAWATRGSDRRVRVVVINDSLHAGARALVHAPTGYGAAAASLERLRASSAYATGGVTLGGRSFGASTATGVLRPPMPQTVASRAGTYPVTLPAASAALLTLGSR